VLDGLPATPALAYAYQAQAALRMLNRDNAEAIAWSHKAITLAEQLEALFVLPRAYNVVGSAMMVDGKPEGRLYLEKSLLLAQSNQLPGAVAGAYVNLGSGAGEMYDFPLADRYLAAGIAYCLEWELEASHHYMLAWQALSHMYQGRWDAATETAVNVINRPNVSAISRIMALIALGRVRTRRGDPGVGAVLDEALELARPTETLQRLAPVRAARAEAAWLAGAGKALCRKRRPCTNWLWQRTYLVYRRTGLLALARR
jgi:hypothetical protein